MSTMLSSDCIRNNSDAVRKESEMLSETAKKNKMNYINKYKREHYKRIPVEVPVEYYTDKLAPAAKKKGISVSAYAKEAIKEKLEREEFE